MDDLFFDRLGLLETLKFSLDFGLPATEDSWLLRLDLCAVMISLQKYLFVIAVQYMIASPSKWLDGPSIFLLIGRFFIFP